MKIIIAIESEIAQGLLPQHYLKQDISEAGDYRKLSYLPRRYSASSNPDQ
jgi:hypothetical protein